MKVAFIIFGLIMCLACFGNAATTKDKARMVSFQILCAAFIIVVGIGLAVWF